MRIGYCITHHRDALQWTMKKEKLIKIIQSVNIFRKISIKSQFLCHYLAAKFSSCTIGPSNENNIKYAITSQVLSYLNQQKHFDIDENPFRAHFCI